MSKETTQGVSGMSIQGVIRSSDSELSREHGTANVTQFLATYTP